MRPNAGSADKCRWSVGAGLAPPFSVVLAWGNPRPVLWQHGALPKLPCATSIFDRNNRPLMPSQPVLLSSTEALAWDHLLRSSEALGEKLCFHSCETRL